MNYQARRPLSSGPLQKNKQKKSKKMWLLCAFSIVFIVAAGVGVLELTNTTHFFHSSKQTDAKTIVTAGKPAKTPAADKPATTNTEKNPATTNGVSQGSAVDNHGAAVNTNSKQWVVSKSGDITVKQPAADATVKSGDIVAGSAKVSQVQYRLIDDEKGVIAQGPLSVVDGNFSGTLQFQAHSSSGRLDIFSLDASGAEINEVQLMVSF